MGKRTQEQAAKMTNTKVGLSKSKRMDHNRGSLFQSNKSRKLSVDSGSILIHQNETAKETTTKTSATTKEAAESTTEYTVNTTLEATVTTQRNLWKRTLQRLVPRNYPRLFATSIHRLSSSSDTQDRDTDTDTDEDDDDEEEEVEINDDTLTDATTNTSSSDDCNDEYDDVGNASTITNTNKNTNKNGAKKKNTHCTKKRFVRFDSVHIRVHDIIVGDHPFCSKGLPLSLDWAYKKKIRSYSLDSYEYYRSCRSPRRERWELRKSSEERRSMLQSGYTPAELRYAERRLYREREIMAAIAEATSRSDNSGFWS